MYLLKKAYFISVEGSAPGTPLTYVQPFAITSYDGSVRLNFQYSQDLFEKKINNHIFSFIYTAIHVCTIEQLEDRDYN